MARGSWNLAGDVSRARAPLVNGCAPVLCAMAPAVPVVDLFADAPTGDPRASAYLLAASAPWPPERAVFLCGVDPGVIPLEIAGPKLAPQLV